MTLKLQLVGGAGAGTAHEFAPPLVRLGRDPVSNDLTIDDSGSGAVSRVHAEARFRDGAWYIADLGSTNGTHVNGRRISEARLRDGDEIQFGTTGPKLRTGLAGEPSEAAAATRLDEARDGGDSTRLESTIASPAVGQVRVPPSPEAARPAGAVSTNLWRTLMAAVVGIFVVWTIATQWQPNPTITRPSPPPGTAGTEAGERGQPAPRDEPAPTRGSNDAPTRRSDTTPGRPAVSSALATWEQLVPPMLGEYRRGSPIVSSYLCPVMTDPVRVQEIGYESPTGLKVELTVAAFESPEIAMRCLQRAALMMIDSQVPVGEAYWVKSADGVQLGLKLLWRRKTDQERRDEEPAREEARRRARERVGNSQAVPGNAQPVLSGVLWSNLKIVFRIQTSDPTDVRLAADEHPFGSPDLTDVLRAPAK